jgi:hypothetical protein
MTRSPISFQILSTRCFSTSSRADTASLYKAAVTDSFPKLEKLFENLSICQRIQSTEAVYPLYNHWLGSQGDKLIMKEFNQNEFQDVISDYTKYVQKNYKFFEAKDVFVLFELLGVYRNSIYKAKSYLKLVKLVESPDFIGQIKIVFANPDTSSIEEYRNLANLFGICADSSFKYLVGDVFLTAIKKFPVSKELVSIFIKHPLIEKVRRTYLQASFWQVMTSQREFLQKLVNEKKGSMDSDDLNFMASFASFFNKIGGVFSYYDLTEIFEQAAMNVNKIEPRIIPGFLQIMITLTRSRNMKIRMQRNKMFDNLLNRFLDSMTGLDKFPGYITELMVKGRITRINELFTELEANIDQIHHIVNIRYILHQLKYKHKQQWNSLNTKLNNKLEDAYQVCLNRAKVKLQEEKKTERDAQETDLAPLLEAINIEFEKNFNEGLVTFSYKITNFKDFIVKNSTNKALIDEVTNLLSRSPDTVIGLQIHSNRQIDPYDKSFNNYFFFIKSLRVGLERPVIGLDLKQSQFKFLLQSQTPDEDLKSMIIKSVEFWLESHRRNPKDSEHNKGKVGKKEDEESTENN